QQQLVVNGRLAPGLVGGGHPAGPEADGPVRRPQPRRRGVVQADEPAGLVGPGAAGLLAPLQFPPPAPPPPRPALNPPPRAIPPAHAATTCPEPLFRGQLPVASEKPPPLAHLPPTDPPPPATSGAPTRRTGPTRPRPPSPPKRTGPRHPHR